MYETPKHFYAILMVSDFKTQIFELLKWKTNFEPHELSSEKFSWTFAKLNFLKTSSFSCIKFSSLGNRYMKQPKHDETF